MPVLDIPPASRGVDILVLSFLGMGDRHLYDRFGVRGMLTIRRDFARSYTIDIRALLLDPPS